MIQLPRRSVARFFIPLIDVLTLMFCIFLLSPMIKPNRLVPAPAPVSESDRLKEERDLLRKDTEQLRAEKLTTLQGRLTVRVLQIDGETGKLRFYDPGRVADRWVEVTSKNIAAIVAKAVQQAAAKDVYFLVLYPRPARGTIVFPTYAQRLEYDRWLSGVAHGYEIPMRNL